MPRGQPQIVVTYDIDANSCLNVSAKEVSSGKVQSIQIKNDSGRLSQADIDRMVREAEQFKEEDELNKKKIEAKNGLENYCFMMKNMVNDPKLDGKIDSGDKDKINNECENAIKWLETNVSATVEEYEGKKKELEGSLGPIMQKIYTANASAGGGGMPGGIPTDGMPTGNMPTGEMPNNTVPIIEEDDCDIADVD